MANGQYSRLRDAVQRYEQRTALLRQILEAIEYDPDFEAELTQLLGELGACRTSKSTNLDLVVTWFKEHDNCWADKDTIAEEVGISDNALHNVIYKTGKEIFENQRDPDYGRRTVWRLKQPEDQGADSEDPFREEVP